MKSRVTGAGPTYEPSRRLRAPSLSVLEAAGAELPVGATVWVGDTAFGKRAHSGAWEPYPRDAAVYDREYAGERILG